MSPTRLLVLAAALTAACGSPPLMLRGELPTAVERPRRIGERGAVLELPPLGEARSEAVADGWPVWVIRHGNGSVSVISAVAPPRMRSAAMLFAGPAPLVRWLPGSRRLLADDVAYDEDGHALGYATGAGCTAGELEDCPRVTESAPELRDLDAFAVTVAAAGDRIVVGALHEPAAPADRPYWVDWDHAVRDAREVELPAAITEVRPLAPLPVATALGRPVGSYTLVAGSLVQWTGAAPRLCSGTPTGAACDASSPRAYGVAAVTVSAATSHVESGTLLVRREVDGLSVIATSRF